MTTNTPNLREPSTSLHLSHVVAAALVAGSVGCGTDYDPEAWPTEQAQQALGFGSAPSRFVPRGDRRPRIDPLAFQRALRCAINPTGMWTGTFTGYHCDADFEAHVVAKANPTAAERRAGKFYEFVATLSNVRINPRARSCAVGDVRRMGEEIRGDVICGRSRRDPVTFRSLKPARHRGEPAELATMGYLGNPLDGYPRPERVPADRRNAFGKAALCNPGTAVFGDDDRLPEHRRLMQLYCPNNEWRSHGYIAGRHQ